MNGERTIDRGQPGKLFEEGLQPLGDRAGHHRLRDLLRFVHVAVHRQDEGPIAPCRSVLLAQQRIEYRDRGVLLPRNAERERIAPRRLVALALIQRQPIVALRISLGADQIIREPARSEEHTSELQSLMRSSYAVFCLKKKKHTD